MCRTGAQCGCGGAASGLPVKAGAAVIVIGLAVGFLATYAGIIALAAAAFAGGMAFVLWRMRGPDWKPQPPAVAARPARPALLAPPKAIEAPRAVTGQVVTPAAVPVRQARP